MQLKYILMTGCLLAEIGHLKAQDAVGAFTLSNLTTYGTARSIGFGGALGSIGGDFSCLSVNPAGIGQYRRSELSITPSLQIKSTSTAYLSETSTDNNSRATVNNYSIVFTDAPTGKRYDRRSWKSVSFGFGMNRVADLNLNTQYKGTNNKSSISQAFESEANYDTTSVRQVGSLGYLGWESYLINRYGLYYKTVVPFTGGVQQQRFTTERGRIVDHVITFGGNYKEKLLVGATLGLPTVRDSINSNFTESLASTNTAANPDTFKSLSYASNIGIRGGGVNFKIGGIWKFSDNFRAGMAFHTPTVYFLTDNFSQSLSTRVGSNNIQLSPNYSLPSYSSSYQFTTPSKMILSASYINKKAGFISADIEFVNYDAMRYIFPAGINPATGYSYKYESDQLNNSIRAQYQSVTNIRIGAELKVTKFFMLRGGLGMYGNPYQGADFAAERTDISMGMGFRAKNLFADFGFINATYMVAEKPYNIDYSTVISSAPTTIDKAYTSVSANTIAMTVGVKF